MKKLIYGLFAIFLFAGSPGQAEPLPQVHIAVAANFAQVLKQLTAFYNLPAKKAQFQVSAGSSGALAVQISHGAPFDLFLSADSILPARLLKDHYGLKVQTYARGQLVLFHPLLKKTPLDILLKTARVVAVANPRHAPYGLAALAVLKSRDIKPARLVRGNSVGQAFLFAETGNADIAFVAKSQVLNKQSVTLIPQKDYPEIKQSALLITKNVTATEFFHFLLSPAAQRIIQQNGYL